MWEYKRGEGIWSFLIITQQSDEPTTITAVTTLLPCWKLYLCALLEIVFVRSKAHILITVYL